jgi:hypothetical protein
MVPKLPEALAEHLQARTAFSFLFLLLDFQSDRPHLFLSRPGAQNCGHAHHLGHHTDSRNSLFLLGLCRARVSVPLGSWFLGPHVKPMKIWLPSNCQKRKVSSWRNGSNSTCLPSKCKALSSNPRTDPYPSTGKKRKYFLVFTVIRLSQETVEITAAIKLPYKNSCSK